MEAKHMFMVDQTVRFTWSKLWRIYWLGMLGERKGKPLHGRMNMRYDHSYVVQATVPRLRL